MNTEDPERSVWRKRSPPYKKKKKKKKNYIEISKVLDACVGSCDACVGSCSQIINPDWFHKCSLQLQNDNAFS